MAKNDVAASAATQYLAFMVGKEELAIDLLWIKEIISYAEPTSVPLSPACIRGVINLRGSVVPVVDLAAVFKLGATAITKRTCIIIVEVTLGGEKTLMGLIADQVSDVLVLPPEDIAAAPSFGTGVHIDYLVGVGKVQHKFVLLLDVNKILSSQELMAAAKLSQPAASPAHG